MTEEWRDIKGYEGLYQVSNLGRVKSLNYNRTRKEKILKPAKNKVGYLQVVLYKNKNDKHYTIHQLVAKTFLENPYNFKEINHKDENPLNNESSNLEWCDRKYNINYGNRTIKASKKINQYDLEGNFIKQWNSIKEATKTLNINNLSACCSGNRKTAGGYVWKYKDIA